MELFKSFKRIKLCKHRYALLQSAPGHVNDGDQRRRIAKMGDASKGTKFPVDAKSDFDELVRYHMMAFMKNSKI